MDSERIVKILLNMYKQKDALLGSVKFVLIPHIERVLSNADIKASIEWNNINDYQLIKQFDDLMRNNTDKLFVFESLFC